jgi:hypothetical protein
MINMAETRYDVPFPTVMTKTVYHRPVSETQVVDGKEVPEFNEPNWEQVDKLIVVMALVVLNREMRLDFSDSMDPGMRVVILERIKVLIDYFK